MSEKIISNGDDARRALKTGLDKVADAVGSTLGPRGRLAVLGKQWGGPTITKDGVTVAKEIELSDPLENLGAQLCKEVASKTNDVAGDGTTTATVLAQALVHEGIRSVTSGGNPAAIKRGVDKAVAHVVRQLEGQKIDVDDKDQIRFVAGIAGNDAEIGQQIADALMGEDGKSGVGKNGVITVEEGKSVSTIVDVVDGMQFDRGYVSPYFATNAERMDCDIVNPGILLYDKRIQDAQLILPILEKCVATRTPLVVIAEDVESGALATLILNFAKGIVQSVAVKSPGFGERRKAMMQDIAALTGATFISEETGISLENVTVAHLGTAERVIVNKDHTTIIGGKGDPKAIKMRVSQIKSELERSDSNYDREKLQERLAKLAGGVAVIKVGAASETAVKEKKHRYEDALSATRAALEEGIVTGGGVALLNCVASLSKDLVDSEALEPDERIGAQIVCKALSVPLRRIAENAGVNGDVVINEIQRSRHGKHYGFNAASLEYTDLMKDGVVDPRKVVRTALENAASIVGLVLTTETCIVQKPEPPKYGPGRTPPEDY